MLDPHLFTLFLATTIPIVCFPGPSVAFILTNSIQQGRRVGLMSMVGVETGYLVHVVGAVVGLSAVITASAGLFTVVRLAGVAWLLWLAWKAFRSRAEGTFAGASRSGHESHNARAAFRGGLLVGALNPKTAVFFLAFLPQFVSADAGPVPLQMLAFGLLFIALACVPDGLWALAGGYLRGFTSKLRLRVLDRTAGVVYCALAAYALTATTRSG